MTGEMNADRSRRNGYPRSEPPPGRVLLDSVLEASSEGILIVDVKGSVVTTNERFDTMWALPEVARGSMTCEEVAQHIDDQLEDAKGFLLELSSWEDPSQDGTMHTLDLKEGRTVEARSEPLILDGDTAARVWRFRDVTTETDSQERMGQFVKVASHDLREPLRSLSGHLELLEMQLDGLDGPAEESLEQALGSAHQMRSMIDQLVAYARAGANARSLEPVSLDEVLEEAVDNVATKIQETGAHVEVHELPRVQGDRAPLARVFQNLLDNAIKYNDKPTPLVNVEAAADPANVQVSVEDNGPGIPEDERDAIFEMFHRGANGKHAPGTGIGLALCREIIERHGGDFHVEESDAGGARFTFTLPAP